MSNPMKDLSDVQKYREELKVLPTDILMERKRWLSGKRNISSVYARKYQALKEELEHRFFVDD